MGGNISFTTFGLTVCIPGYLVAGVIAYSTLVTTAMMIVGHPLVGVAQRQMQAEAEFRAAANLLRETGEGMVTGSEPEQRRTLWRALEVVLARWRDLCWQLMRMTLISHGNPCWRSVVRCSCCGAEILAGTMSLANSPRRRQPHPRCRALQLAGRRLYGWPIGHRRLIA